MKFAPGSAHPPSLRRHVVAWATVLVMTAVAVFGFDSASEAMVTPSIESPAAGALLNGPFAVVTVDHATLPVTSGWIVAGSTPRGDDYSARHVGTSRAGLISGLPADGSLVYVTYYYQVGGAWAFDEAIYQRAAEPQPRVVWPADGYQLTGTTTNVYMDTAGATLQSSWLTMGTSPEGTDLAIHHLGTQTTTSVAGLPSDGSSIYVTYFAKVAGSWSKQEIVYQATGVTTVPPVLMPPAPEYSCPDGYELLNEGASFLCVTAIVGSSTSPANVVVPDPEYSCPVDDNVYTETGSGASLTCTYLVTVDVEVPSDRVVTGTNYQCPDGYQTQGAGFTTSCSMSIPATPFCPGGTQVAADPQFCLILSSGRQVPVGEDCLANEMQELVGGLPTCYEFFGAQQTCPNGQSQGTSCIVFTSPTTSPEFTYFCPAGSVGNGGLGTTLVCTTPTAVEQTAEPLVTQLDPVYSCAAGSTLTETGPNPTCVTPTVTFDEIAPIVDQGPSTWACPVGTEATGGSGAGLICTLE